MPFYIRDLNICRIDSHRRWGPEINLQWFQRDVYVIVPSFYRGN
jgi:hypothetical protein